MKTLEPLTQEQADREEIIRLVAEGKRVTDPELRRRITGRADRVREEIVNQHGLVDWAVPMIREARDE